MYTNYPYTYLHKVTTANYSPSVIALPDEAYRIQDELSTTSNVRYVSYTEESGSGGLYNNTYTAANSAATTIETRIFPLNGTAPWDQNTVRFVPTDITTTACAFPSSKRYLPHCYLIKDSNQSPAYKLFALIPTVSEHAYTITVQDLSPGATERFIIFQEVIDTSFADAIWDGETEYFDSQNVDTIHVKVFALNSTVKGEAWLRCSLADNK